jgi:Cys-tRNA(Pro)/Cys-tRNA(Cys) deacylase
MTPATRALDKAGIDYRLHRYDHDPKAQSYGTEAAEKLGLDPARVFKTLLVTSDAGELLVAVVPVIGMLDLKALATAAKVKKTAMANPAAAQRSTGYLLGGISPLGQKKALRTFIDSSATQWSSLYVSGGRRGLEIELMPQQLALQTGAQIASLARLPAMGAGQ